jgi:hypothetical protein
MHRFACLLLLPALACGDVRTVGPTDAGADAAADASASGEVTVELENLFEDDETFGDPWGDIPVLFFGPDGALIAEEASDDDGVASATVPPGSTVVVVPPAFDTDEFVTFSVHGVQPGDTIRFPAPAVEPTFAPLGTMTVTYPEFTDAVSYRASNGCGENVSEGAGLAIVLNFTEECVTGDEFDVVVRALAADDTVLGHVKKHGTFSDGDPVAAGAWDDHLELVVQLTGIPTVARNVRASARPAVGPVTYGSHDVGPFDLTDDTFDVELTTADDFGTSIDVELTYEPAFVNLGGQSALYRLAPGTDELPVALDDELLPWYGLPVFDQAGRRLTWTRTGGGAAGDAQYVYLQTESKSNVRVEWLAIVPADVTDATLPELPDEYQERFPTDVAEAQTTVIAVDTSDYEGYEIIETGILPFFTVIGIVPRTQSAPGYYKVSLAGGL